MALPINGSSLSHQELLDAQAHVWNHTFNFINSMSLKCAIELGIPDIIHKHGKPMSLSDLVDALPINKAKSNGIYRLMRILVHSKFFNITNEIEQDEGYCLAPASRLLLRDEPSNMTPFVLAMVDPIFVDPWHRFREWFQNDCVNAYATTHGKPLYDHMNEDPRLNQVVNEGLASDADLVARILAKECKQVFEGLGSMVDVGGGTGAVAKAIAEAFPGLQCIVLDLPHVVAGLEDSENLRFVSGDMFESIPHADAVFLKWILHDWSEEECVQILKRCKDAISENRGGKVIIVGMVVEKNQKDMNIKAIETQLFFDMAMMTVVNGKVRTDEEYSKLFSSAGFTSYKITPVLGLRSLIEVFP